jgi:thiamine kinase-like enzyme
MNHSEILEDEGLINSDSLMFNAVALPSIKQVKYLISLDNKKVFFSGLTMLSARSFKARLAKIILKMSYRLGLISYLWKANLACINKKSGLYALILENYQQSQGVNFYFGSAKNQNFSITIQVVEQSKDYYIRYPLSSLSKVCAANEYKNLKHLYLQGLGLSLQKIDKVIPYKTDNIYSYEGISAYTTKTALCNNKIKLLREMTFSNFEQLKSNIFFQELNLKIEELLNNPDYQFSDNIRRIYKNTVETIATLYLKTAFFHGDFSPDNVLISSGESYLIDFEYSNDQFFSCFDLFHYLYKARRLHLKVITIKEIQLIGDSVKRTYGQYPFYTDEKKDEFMLLQCLFIFYLFFLLKRYVVDEKLNMKSDVLNKLRQSIYRLGSVD